MKDKVVGEKEHECMPHFCLFFKISAISFITLALTLK